jgi:NACalpha-BTF3-like transcription factor
MNFLPLTAQTFKLSINFDNKIPSIATIILTEELNQLKDKAKQVDELNLIISKLKAILHHQDESKKVDDIECKEIDINLVISQTNCNRNEAVKALKNNGNDIVSAILELQKQ